MSEEQEQEQEESVMSESEAAVVENDEDFEEFEDEEEDEAPPPPPPPPQPTPPRPAPQPQRQQARQKPRPRQQVRHAQPQELRRGIVGAAPTGPGPLDYLEEPHHSDTLRIERIKANADDDGVNEVGFCMWTPNVVGFEENVRRVCGGGDYTAMGFVNGQSRQVGFSIAGPSKSIRGTEEGEEEEEESEDYSSSTPYRYRGRGGYGFRDPFDDPYGPSSFRTTSGYGYGHGGYGPQNMGPQGYGPQPQHPGYGPQNMGPQGYGPQPGGFYQSPPGPWSGAPGQFAPPPQGQVQIPGFAPVPGMPNVYVPVEKQSATKNEEIEALKAEIEAARAETRAAAEQAAGEREERRIEAERAQAREREDSLRRELDNVRSESDRKFETLMNEIRMSSKSKGGEDVFSRMAEMNMLNFEHAKTRMEQERIEREQRWREEQSQRREESERREREYRQQQDSEEKRRKEDQKRLEDRQRDDRQRDEDRRKDQEKHYQHMLEMSIGQKQTPEQMLGMLKTMIDLNPRPDTMTEVMKLAQVAVTVKEMLGGNEQAESQWVTVVKTAAEAVGTAVRDIQSQRTQQAQQVQVVSQQPQQLAGPRGPVRQVQAQHPSPEQASPNGEEWGRILGFAVDSYEANNDPADVATHLHTMVVVGMQRPRAIEKLEKATVGELSFQLSTMSLMPQVSQSPYGPKIERARQVLETTHGKVWFTALLRSLAMIQNAIRGQAAAQAEGGLDQEEEGEETEEEVIDEAEEGEAEEEVDVDQLSPAEFAARDRGTPKSEGPATGGEISPEEFSRRARATNEPKKDPTGGWGS